MKKFSKVLAVILAAVSVFGCFAACSNESKPTSSDSDLAYIQGKGKLVVGITDFAPMDYKDANGEWIGFDADLGRIVAEKLGVDIEFREIDWDNKFFELDTKGIDCAWNGMTITDTVKLNSDTTQAYAKNQQVVVMKADKVADYTTVESLKALSFAVENGSAGKDIAEENELNITVVNKQSDALFEVKSGAVDACIIDSTMAAAMTGEGTDYSDLTAGLTLIDEDYGIAFRKGSDMVDKMNELFEEFKTDGTLKELAEKYNVQLAD